MRARLLGGVRVAHARRDMRALLAVLLLAGCSTVESATVLSSTRGLEHCRKGDLVATVFPADWPNVTLEVHEERTCATPIEQTVKVDRELRLSRDVPAWVGGGLGAGVGVAAMVLTLKALPQAGSYNRADGLLMLPLGGALAGATLASSLPHEQQTQRLPSEVRVVTEYEERSGEELPSIGLLTLEGRGLVELRDGRAHVPVDLAMSIYQRPIRLGDRRVWWSLRPGSWVPGRLPACERAAAASQPGDLYRLSLNELLGLEADADRCGRDEWLFARSLRRKVGEVCRERFGPACGPPR